MDNIRYILTHTGKVTINHEYTVTIAPGQALAIDWFPNNDLSVTINGQTTTYNEQNTTRQADGTYLIQTMTTTTLHDLPVQFERGDYLVAGNVVIDHGRREYFEAEKLDILPDEIVALHHQQVTRVLFSGDKTAVEHYLPQ